MTKRTFASILSVVMAGLWASSAQAASLNLSTGLDALYNNVLIGNTPDAFWTVDQPLGGIAPAKIIAPGNLGAAFPSWAANGPVSSWITIDPDSIGNGSKIPYTYYRSFSLSAAEVPLASISGTWGIDDGGEVRLNGNLLSSSPADYSASTPFSAAAGSGFFVAGLNTLTITMTTSDNFFEAVRLEAKLDTPEPASMTILGISLAGFAGYRLRRRKVAAN